MRYGFVGYRALRLIYKGFWAQRQYYLRLLGYYFEAQGLEGLLDDGRRVSWIRASGDRGFLDSWNDV